MKQGGQAPPTMDGHESPLKAWVRRHSPIKGRHNSNKPLPPAPLHEQVTQDSSPCKRVPISAISGNANAAATVNPQPKSKKRISSLLKHKSSAPASSSQSQARPVTPVARQTTGRSQSAAGYHEHVTRDSMPSIQRSMSQDNRIPQQTSQPRPSRMASHSPTLRTLTDRVSSLESQLRAARAEIASMTQLGNRISPNPRRALSIEGELIERDVEERYARLQGRGRYDGLVECLLEPNYAAASASASRSRRSASLDRDAPYATYEAVELAYGEDEAQRRHISRLEDAMAQEQRNLTRRRSEIRAASWKQVQEHMAAAETKQQPALVSLSKKRSRSQDIPRSQLVIDETIKDQPPPRKRKQSHEKELPGYPPHERSRSASTEHGEHRFEGGIRAVAPPRQQYYTDEQAKTHATQAQSSSPRRGHVRTSSQTNIAGPLSTVKKVSEIESPPKSDLVKTSSSNRREREEKDGEVIIDLDDAMNKVRKHPEEPSKEGPPSPWRRHVPSPSRLQTVNEEFEWNDEEIF